uniref:Uncharacterized protein n=1 Tax=Diacronema lutheri TaxID=2081491 RepID=A0A7R9UVA8_DIALT|mmetsp:Transcript_4787/g.14804  ORF Transcript_4787/g.14804 Transcript_4787/m.14804 type:complete len:349 (+) Transcript_4787:281-1327(+)
MYKTKDGTSRSKAPVEESHVTNTSTLRSVFAKSAKLEAFDVLDTLGTGTFGRVRLCRHTDTGRYQALKIMKKSEVVRLKQVDHIKSEKEILTAVQHPFIITLYGVFQDERNLYMVLEYVPGGELFTHLRKAGKFTNDQTRFYAAQIVMAVQALHADSIVYRDLKPENLLLDEDGYLKITDFGFAKYVEDRTWTLCGTPEYLAPEIIQSRGHGKAVDWWALGILIYEMLAGYPPFYDEDPLGIYQKILEGKIKFPWHFDRHSKDVIKRLLTADLTKRIGNLKGGADDIKKHKWFVGLDWEQLHAKELSAPILPEVKSKDDTSNFDKYPDSNEEQRIKIDARDQALFKDF